MRKKAKEKNENISKIYIFPAESIPQTLQKIIQKAIVTLGLKKRFREINIEKASHKHGDFASNIAMTLAKELKQSPYQIALKLIKSIKNVYQKDMEIMNIEVAGPGFINFTLSAKVYTKKLQQITDNYGQSQIMAGKTMMVEFGQPNTHKAITVGHLRSGIMGLAVVHLQEKLGYKVIKANYFGDVGMQTAKTTWAVKKEGLPENFVDLDPHIKGKIIAQHYVLGAKEFNDNPQSEIQIREINKKIYQHNNKDSDYKLHQRLRKWSIEHQDQFFSELGIKYDRQYPESEVATNAVSLVKQNINNVFTKSKGAIIYDGKKYGLTTWVFLTKESLPTYSAKDLALFAKKNEEYKLDSSLILTSTEQKDYFDTLIHCIERVFPKLKNQYKHLPFGWVLLNNKKTSSRLGNAPMAVDLIEDVRQVAQQKIAKDKNYTLKQRKEIVEKIAMAGLKFLILSHEFHKDINYDPEKFMNLDGFSGPFVMYSYARIQAILRKSTIDTFNTKKNSNLYKLLNKPAEIALVKELVNFPTIVLRSAFNIAPHLVCHYVYQVAQKFNNFYQHHSVLHAETLQQQQARLILTFKTGLILKQGLQILGIETVERM